MSFNSRYLPQLTATVFLALAIGGRSSRSAAEPVARDEPLPEVLVTGERPGPALWRVSKDDHDLWILATLVPLPKKMVWRSHEVETRIGSSQVVISPPQFTPDISIFRGITLIPSLLHARHSPDGKSLEETLPHDVYIRWLALRVKYLGHGDEKDRPLVAAFDLYSHALEQVGLTLDDDAVWDVVKQTAKFNHVPIEYIDIKVPLDDPKGAINSLSAIRPTAELDCFERTLGSLETDIPSMIHRANLWSMGDIEGLRAVPASRQTVACRDAFVEVPQLESRFSRIDQSMKSAWLTAAEQALAANVSSFTVLPISEVIDDDGLVANLRAKGYRVEQPRNAH